MRTDTEGAHRLAAWMAAQPSRPTNTEIAKLLGVSSVTFAEWLTGEGRPREHNRVAIHVLAGIEPESWRTAKETVDMRAALARVEAWARRAA